MSNDSAIIDFDSAKARQMFNGWIKTLSGQHRVSIRKVRANRSNNANAFYWAAVLPAIVEGLDEAWGESMTVEEAHEFLKGRFNARTVVNRGTGEVVDRLPCSTATLDTKEFTTYLDRVIQFAAEYLKVEVPTPA